MVRGWRRNPGHLKIFVGLICSVETLFMEAATRHGSVQTPPPQGGTLKLIPVFHFRDHFALYAFLSATIGRLPVGFLSVVSNTTNPATPSVPSLSLSCQGCSPEQRLGFDPCDQDDNENV